MSRFDDPSVTNSKDFAEKYAGMRVTISDECEDTPNGSISPICRIIGWSTDYTDTIVVGDFECPDAQSRAWPLTREPGITLVVSDHKGRGWTVPLRLIKSCRVKQLDNSPYPHVCRKCHAPARNMGAHVLCSNDKCSTRRAIKLALFGPRVKHERGSIQNPIKVRCPTCHVLVRQLRHSDMASCQEHGEFPYGFEKGKYYIHSRINEPVKFIAGMRVWSGNTGY